MSKSSSPSPLPPGSFIRLPRVEADPQEPRAGRFGELADRFSEFRALVACLAETAPPGLDADAAWQVASGLDMWACFVDDAREAAARAPETDAVLAHAWATRLADIVREARYKLKLDATDAGKGGAGSIARHETAFPVSRIAKPASKPAARPTRRRSPRPARRRR